MTGKSTVALVLWLCSVLPSYAGSRLVFPRVTFQDGRFAGIAVANPTSAAAEVRITAYNPDGSRVGGGAVNPQYVTIPAGGQFARLAREIFVPTTILGDVKLDHPVWLEATSTTDGLEGYFLEGTITLQSMDGAGVGGSGTDLILPVTDLPAGSATDISLINPEDTAVEVIAELLKADGGMLSSRILQLSALNALNGPLTVIDPDNASQAAYVRLRAAHPVVCYGFVVEAADEPQSAVPAIVASLATKTLLFPRLLQGDSWSTRVGLVNVSEATVVVKLTAFGPDGTLVGAPVVTENPVNRTLAPHALLEAGLDSLFGWKSARLETGWLKVESTEAAIAGYVEFLAGKARTFVPAYFSPFKRALVPHQAVASPFFSRLAVMNPGSLAANIEVISLSSSSEIVGRARRVLKPGQLEDSLLQEWIPNTAGVVGGTVFIKSDVPILAGQIIGTDTLSEIANVPPQELASDYDPASGLPQVAVAPPLAVVETGKTLRFAALGLSGTKWLVEGVEGGNASLGTVSPAGVYTAPAIAPDRRNLTIQALGSLQNVSAGATVDVVQRETVASGLTVVTAMAYAENLQRFFVAEQLLLASSPGSSERIAAAVNSRIRERTVDGAVLPFLDLPGETVGKIVPYASANLHTYLLIAGTETGVVYRLDVADRQLTRVVTGLKRPSSMVLDPVTGDLLVAEDEGGRITLIPRSQFDPAATTAAVPGAEAAGGTEVGPRYADIAVQSPQGVAIDDETGAIYVSLADGTIHEFMGTRDRIVASGLDRPGEMLVLHRDGILPRRAGTSILVCERNRVSELMVDTGLLTVFYADLVNTLDIAFLPPGNPFTPDGSPGIAIADAVAGDGNARVIRISVVGLYEGTTATGAGGGPAPAPSLPYIDPIGDTFAGEATSRAGLAVHDIVSVDAVGVGDSVVLTVTFNGSVSPPGSGSPNGLYGTILIDNNPASGGSPGGDPYNPFQIPNGLSVDGVIDTASRTLQIGGGAGTSAADPRVVQIPVFYLGNSISVTVPATVFDIARSRIATRFGNSLEVTDVTPNLRNLEVDTEKGQVATVQFARPASAVSSNRPYAELDVTLSAYRSTEVRVQYSVTGGSAVAGRDFVLAPGTLVFTPGETTRKITLSLPGDLALRSDQTVDISLAGPVGAQLGTPATHRLTIQNVAPIPTVGFATAASSGPESVSLVSIPVVLSNPSLDPISVSYSVAAGTAVSGLDFTPASGTLSFAPLDTQKSIVFTVFDNADFRPDRTVVLTLTAPPPIGLGLSQHVYTIRNDDFPTVSFQAASSSGDEAVTPASIVATLSAASPATVTVQYAVTGGTATGGGTDFTLPAGTLTFSPGVTSQTIQLAVVDDNMYETDETVVVTLSAPTNAILGAPTTHTYTIRDNDPVPTVGFASNTSSAAESVTAATISVVLSNPSYQTITVQYADVLDATATPGVDYVLPATGTVTFPPGVTSRNISFTVINDGLFEEDEYILLDISAPVNATLGSPSFHEYTILNDDPIPAVAFAAATSSIPYTSSIYTADIPIVLSAASGAFTSVDVAVGAATPTTVYFPEGTTVVLFPVTVDYYQTVGTNITLTLSNPAQATLGAPSTHTITIVAAPSVQFQASGLTVANVAQTVNIVVTLSAAQSVPVQVGYQRLSTDFDAIIGPPDGTSNIAPFALPGVVTFLPGEISKAIQVQVLQDSPIPPRVDPVYLWLQLSGPNPATLGAITEFTLTINP